jgi:mRNA interferase HigB
MEISAGLDAWYRVAKTAKWSSLEDVQQPYPSADGVRAGKQTYTVFNIRGNRFRLIVKIEYRFQTIYIKDVLTHAEYDRNGWKKALEKEQRKMERIQ